MPALLSYGFRPFFLLAAAYAVVAVFLWVCHYLGITNFIELSAIQHGYEMVFGFTQAIVIGFILTASPKWTKTRHLQGLPVLALSLIWCCARIFQYLNGDWVYIIDMNFILLNAAVVGKAIWMTKNWRNLLFPGLFIIQALSLLAGYLEFLDMHALVWMNLHIQASFIAIVGGRIIPAFTQNGLKQFHSIEVNCRRVSWLDKLSVAFIIIAVACGLCLGEDRQFTGVSLIIAGILNVSRLWGWFGLKTWREPLLWIMHISFMWVSLGFFVEGVFIVNQLPINTALHIITIGGIGGFTLGMMSRVSLGHTGRKLKIPNYIVIAFIFVQISLFTRLFVEGFYELLSISAVLWVCAFALFLWRYAPILIKENKNQ